MFEMTELLCRAKVEQMKEHFLQMLEMFTLQPDSRVSRCCCCQAADSPEEISGAASCEVRTG